MPDLILHRGDTLTLGGVQITTEHTVTLQTSAPLTKTTPPNLYDLPETPLRVRTLWPDRRGARLPMTTRDTLRCRCGSLHTRQSDTHLSCLYCGRVWVLAELPNGLMLRAMDALEDALQHAVERAMARPTTTHTEEA